MRTGSKLTCIALSAALLAAVMVGNTSANRLSISHGGLFRIEWSSLEFGIQGLTVVRCAVTLEGSFHSTTMPKVQGLLVGHISRASVKNNPCISGNVTVLAGTLPWHIVFRGFSGALPSITGGIVGLLGASFRVVNAITRCLVTATLEHPGQIMIEEIEGSAGNRIFRTARTDETATVECRGVEGGTSVNGAFRGAGSIREVEGGRPGSQNLLVRLI